MTQMEIQSPIRGASNGYKVDISRGQNIGRVSSEWFNRPADERYLSLTDLHNSVKHRSERSKTRIVESEAVRVEASRDNPERLTLMLGVKRHAPTVCVLASFALTALRGRLGPLCTIPMSPLSACPHAAWASSAKPPPNCSFAVGPSIQPCCARLVDGATSVALD